MTEQEFDDLTAKYQKGDCKPEEVLLIENWARRMYEQSDASAMSENEEEVNLIETRIWKRLMQVISPPKPSTNAFKQLLLWPLLVAAACLSVVCGYFLIDSDRPTIQAEKPSHGLETRNTTTSTQKIFLADGSTVLLEKGADILIDENYGKRKRKVYLTGEAFFEVKRNEKVPFLVYSGGLVTEVLGTSFHIKPEGVGKSIEVSVKSGKVSVYSSHPHKAGNFDGVILTPNQKVHFDPELQTIRQEIVDSPRIVTTGAELPNFDFHEESIETVIGRLSTAYGVEIVLPGSGLGRCKFIGNLSGLPMYEQLRFVCESVGARFETRGTTIFISGNGCE
ncbi:FecR family protein [Persicitalea jodogahamensis]|uniref:Anti-sigma factor n=1 Tax=Persicitalea jodogahamensis TaxID=402147 RepID=A0A8J3DDB5_9BACT|nr:FecR family protein [Persicitalea jodogahamensis]GHB86465.1 anti-sigma factor [Persicitalea jodogahamensis]